MRSEKQAQRINNPYLAAFNYRNFRIYFAGQLISVSGTWMQRVAQGWLVFSLTQSEWWLGVVAFVSGIAMLLAAPLAGVWADRFSRRWLLIGAQAMEMFLALLLAYLAFTASVQVEYIVVLAFCLGLATAVGEPARQALLRDMVGKAEIASGLSLNATMTNMAAVIGPTVAGVLLLHWGAAACFLFNGLSYLAVIVSLLFIRIADGGKIGSVPTHFLRQILEGLRYVRRQRTIAITLLTASISGALGIGMIHVLLPAYASENLGQPEIGLVAVSAAMGLGSIVAGVGNVWLERRWGQKRLVTSSVLLLPFGSLLLSQINQLWFAVLVTAVLGFGYTIFFVNSNVLIQLTVENSYRGRVFSLWSMNRFGISPISALIIGGIAQVLGVSTALWLCGLLAFIMCYWLLAKK